MSRADKTLHLVLHGKPYDDIERGFKPVEYRDGTKPKWRDLEFDLENGVYKFVRFQRGFHKDPRTGRVPTMLFEIQHADNGATDPRWTYGIVPDGREFVRIWIGKRIK